MDLVELIKKLKEEFHFKLNVQYIGYSLYKSELYNLTFDYGMSNGDRYYYVKEGENILMREDLPAFIREKTEAEVYNKIYSVIRSIVRQKKIDKLI